MIERGYRALLVVVGAAVAIVAFIAYSNRSSISSIFFRADTSLNVVLPYVYDSVEFKTIYPPRKSQRTLSIELNTADTAALVRIYGIGSAFARRIVERREALGGYYSVEQLREVRGIDREVYERIAKNFFVDTALIQKININFAIRKMLNSHPYITTSMAVRIERARMEGGYITESKELTNRNILLPKEALRVTPYLSFDTIINR